MVHGHIDLNIAIIWCFYVVFWEVHGSQICGGNDWIDGYLKGPKYLLNCHACNNKKQKKQKNTHIDCVDPRLWVGGPSRVGALGFRVSLHLIKIKALSSFAS